MAKRRPRSLDLENRGHCPGPCWENQGLAGPWGPAQKRAPAEASVEASVARRDSELELRFANRMYPEDQRQLMPIFSTIVPWSPLPARVPSVPLPLWRRHGFGPDMIRVSFEKSAKYPATLNLLAQSVFRVHTAEPAHATHF